MGAMLDNGTLGTYGVQKESEPAVRHRLALATKAAEEKPSSKKIWRSFRIRSECVELLPTGVNKGEMIGESRRKRRRQT